LALEENEYKNDDCNDENKQQESTKKNDVEEQPTVQPQITKELKIKCYF